MSGGGCEFGCRNTIGAHECYCYYGHRLINTTHCDNEIHYIVVQGIENEDYRFSCHADQNLTIQNFTCENIPPQTTAATTTTPSGCPIGYLQRNTGECVDEDECDFYTSCQHSCVNTEGSFHCECNEGYELVDDGYSCDDFNECHILNGGCEFGCRNTNGSHQCYCYHGYGLKNETHCDNEIQCHVLQNVENEDYQFTCHGNYNLTLTNFTCENILQASITTATSTTTIATIATTTASSGCPIGYLQRNTGECVDEDECDFYTNCQHSCVNTEGSFHCGCNEGYEVADDGYSCDDINECRVWNGGCEFGCRNSIGSYQCYCYYGLELKNETHCDDEIQCLVQNIDNELYHITCLGDYNITLTNFNCENITQITATTTTAAPSGCPIGFLQRNTGECVDEDECDFYTNCQHSCDNTEGSFHCECNEGFELTDDGYSCNDINECHEMNGECEFGCRNTNGSHQCYCYYGLELKNKTHCDTEIQCDKTQDDASQGNHFTCREGFNLTINNLISNNSIEHTTIQTTECPSIAASSVQFQASTVIMFTILILIIAVQTVIIILVLVCTLAMRKTAKNPKIHRNMRQGHFQENVEISLDDIIEKQPNIPPNMIMQNPDNTEAISMHENTN